MVMDRREREADLNANGFVCLIETSTKTVLQLVFPLFSFVVACGSSFFCACARKWMLFCFTFPHFPHGTGRKCALLHQKRIGRWGFPRRQNTMIVLRLRKKWLSVCVCVWDAFEF